MVWTPDWPDTSKSVKVNGPTGSANSAYIKTTENVDHYWDVDALKDGFHKKVHYKENTDITAIAPAGDESLIATTGTPPLPWFKNSTGKGYLVPVGAKVKIKFSDGSQLGTSLNIASVTKVGSTFTVVMTDSLADANYLIHAQAEGGASTIATAITNTTTFVIVPTSVVTNISIMVYGQIA